MNGVKVGLCFFVCFTTILKVSAHVKEHPRGAYNSSAEEHSSLQIFPGVMLQIQGKEINIYLYLRKIFSGNDVDARGYDKQPKPLRRIGGMLMMIPVAMQMLSLPGALASIKESLLKSLFMSKIALIMIIYNAIRSSLMAKEVVVVHKIPAQHHDHYYHPQFDDEVEDTGGSWWGK